MHPGVAMTIKGSPHSAPSMALWVQHTLLGLRHNYRVRLPGETGIHIVQPKPLPSWTLAVPSPPFLAVSPMPFPAPLLGTPPQPGPRAWGLGKGRATPWGAGAELGRTRHLLLCPQQLKVEGPGAGDCFACIVRSRRTPGGGQGRAWDLPPGGEWGSSTPRYGPPSLGLPTGPSAVVM